MLTDAQLEKISHLASLDFGRFTIRYPESWGTPRYSEVDMGHEFYWNGIRHCWIAPAGDHGSVVWDCDTEVYVLRRVLVGEEVKFKLLLADVSTHRPDSLFSAGSFAKYS